MGEGIDLMKELRDRRGAFSDLQAVPERKKQEKSPAAEGERKDRPVTKPKKALVFGEKLAPAKQSYAPYRGIGTRTRMSVTLSGENKAFLDKLSKARNSPINQTLNEIIDEYRHLYEENL